MASAAGRGLSRISGMAGHQSGAMAELQNAQEGFKHP
jgi:hypothetical protein